MDENRNEATQQPIEAVPVTPAGNPMAKKLVLYLHKLLQCKGYQRSYRCCSQRLRLLTLIISLLSLKHILDCKLKYQVLSVHPYL